MSESSNIHAVISASFVVECADYLTTLHNVKRSGGHEVSEDTAGECRRKCLERHSCTAAGFSYDVCHLFEARLPMDARSEIHGSQYFERVVCPHGNRDNICIF